MRKRPFSFLSGAGANGGIALLGLGSGALGDVCGQPGVVYDTQQTCDCPAGYAWTFKDGRFWCQAITQAADGSWKFDWSQVPGAIGGLVSIFCKLTGKGCPDPVGVPGGGYPPGYFEPAWYSTPGGMIGIVGGLGLLGGLGYMIWKK